jgi:LSU ribosomal protein L29P
MKLAELKKLSQEQLHEKLVSERQELMNLRFSHVAGQLENTAQIPAKRRTIARILTLMKKGA